ncbi:hypothetical protein DMB42_38740 [Nonomuraea sp. WAC 01424]|uniref:DUF4158 domain-containing protein n=1 Tax=Nonomuraea sp. WAC 01424 TaxID=2203200 RepID=UPI000F79EA1D|nr:hypothetical protein DMB42_38740 [Nonomuraea sp. WAC 01424]
MEKIFFLDNEDMALTKGHRGRHIRCGFTLQLGTVRYLGDSWLIRWRCRTRS